MPVILIVWDVERREGRWILIHDIIQYLDQKRPMWRTQKKVSVYIPWENTTDNDGLYRLKASMGKQLYSLITKDQSYEIKFKTTFPEYDKNAEKQRLAFERWIKEGEAVTLDSPYVNLQLPEWYSAWFEPNNSQQFKLTLGTKFSTETIMAKISVKNIDNSFIYISELELSPIQVGTEVIHLSNTHQNSKAIHLHLVMSNPKISGSLQINITLRFNGLHVDEIIQAIKFLKVLNKRKEIHLSFVLNGKSFRWKAQIQNTILIEPEIESVFQNLKKIQEEMDCIFCIPEMGITEDDLYIINEIIEIISLGRTTRNYSKAKLTGNFKLLKTIHDNYQNFHYVVLELQIENRSVELFGEHIHFGPVIQRKKGRISFSKKEIEKKLAQKKEKNELTLIDYQVETIYQNYFIDSSPQSTT